MGDAVDAGAGGTPYEWTWSQCQHCRFYLLRFTAGGPTLSQCRRFVQPREAQSRDAACRWYEPPAGEDDVVEEPSPTEIVLRQRLDDARAEGQQLRAALFCAMTPAEYYGGIWDRAQAAENAKGETDG